MSLSDRLAETPSAADRKYTPSVEFDDRGATVETGPVEAEPGQPPECAELLRSVGRDPDKWRIVEVLRESHWQTYDERWLHAYRLRCEPIDNERVNDLEAIVAQATAKAREYDSLLSDPYWFVFQAGDLQLGKRSRDGATEQIIERFVESVDRAKRQLRAWSPLGIAGVQISMPGDCIEGVVSQGGRNSWLTQETITEQTRILRRLMLYAVDELADAPAVELHAVNGNHDQAQRQWNTYPGDGWATEAATAVDDAIKLNPTAYSHVTVRVPNKWSGHMTVPVGDTVVTIVHGHQWGRGGAMRWWADQAVHNQPPGAAHLLQHGHGHTWRVEGHASKTVVSSPTFDCGSDWFRERNGGESRRGAVTYLLRRGDVSRMGIV